LFARIGVMRALNRHVVREFNSACRPSAAKYLERKGPKVLTVLDEVASATVATPT
jgi:aryl-alcohol dehydrogenase-like predicted oxidoreductase